MAEELIEVKVEPDDNVVCEYEDELIRMQEQQEALLMAATPDTASPMGTTTTTTASSVTVKVEDELDIKNLSHILKSLEDIKSSINDIPEIKERLNRIEERQEKLAEMLVEIAVVLRRNLGYNGAEYMDRFPLKNLDDLQNINEELRGDKRTDIIIALRKCCGEKLGNIEAILHKKIILDFNYDGSRGKISFKEYKFFLEALFAEFDIKEELEEEEDESSKMNEINSLSLVGLEDMKVVDEQSDIITLSAATKKSEDEQNFMMSCLAKTKPARKRKQTFYHQTCTQCKETFNTRRSYEQHSEFGLCTMMEKKHCCSVCPLSFSSQVQLDTHLSMHRLNRFFCAKHCGKFFITLDECKMHEYRQHKVRNIMCSVCQHKFTSCKALIQHMNSHSGLKRFVCSYCHVWFECSMDLAKHWKLYADTCGRLMQHYSSTIESVETTLAERNEAVNNESKIDKQEDLMDAYDRSSVKRVKLAMEECEKQAAAIKTYLSLNDVQIKNEPVTDHEIADDLQSVLTNPTSTNESETSSVFIKSEPYDSEMEIKQEPDYEDDYIRSLQPISVDAVNNPGFKVIPVSTVLSAQQSSNGQTHKVSNLRLVRLPGLPPTPPVVPSLKQTTVGLKPLQIQNQNIKVPPMNLKAYKIYKIMPNTKMLRLPSGAIANGTTITTKSSNTVAPIILKLKATQSVMGSDVNVNLPNVTMSPTTQSTISMPPKLLASTVTTANTEPKPIVVQLSSLDANTSIDAEDLKRLVIEAEAAKNSAEASVPVTRKNICKTKEELQKIEKLPQKRALIENWKQQVKQFETPAGNNENKVDEIATKAEFKLEAKVETNQEEAKQDSNLSVKDEPKLMEKYESKLTTNLDLKSMSKKENVGEIFDSSNTFENIVTIKQETLFNNNDENIDDDDDADDYDTKSLVIDEDEDGNTSNSSLSTNAAVTTSETTTNINASQDPPTFYLPVTSDCDPVLQATRKLYPHLRYQWRCPRCPRAYAQKHSFRGHLVSVHGMCQEEFVKLIVEVKPSECAKSLEELKISPKTPLQLNSESESESNVTNDSNGSITDTTQNSQPKSGRNSSKLTCVKCGRVCSTRTALNDHVLANCSREPQYPCTICPKRFYSASTLNQHMSIHTGALPHKCSYCDKRFRTRGQVTVHHRTHTGERPFECQVCGQRFTHRETLISHLSRHIGMKRYKCYACNQQFACISGLKTHREVRFSSCGKVKLNTRAIGPRVRVIKGNVIFEAQPEINPYLRTEDPQQVLAEVQNVEKC